MTLHPTISHTSVEGKERLLNHSHRQKSRNRQRSMLMRTIQQVSTDLM